MTGFSAIGQFAIGQISGPIVFSASTLAVSAAGIGQPVLVQVVSVIPSNLINTYPREAVRSLFGIALGPTTISSGAVSLGQPILNILIHPATSLAAGSAGIGQPGISFFNIPIIRSISSTAFGSRTNITLTPPAGLVDNDILLAFIVNSQIGAESNATIAPASGFNQIGSDQVVVDSNNTFLRGAVYWKRAAGESGNYTFTTSSGNSEGILIDVSGVVTAGLIDVSIQTAGSVLATSTTAGSTQNLNASTTSITTTFIDDLAIYLTSAFSGYPSAVAPVGINALLNDIQNGMIFAGWEPELHSGTATGAVSMQVNSSANAWLAYLICVRSSITLNVLSPNSLGSGAIAIGQPIINQNDVLGAISLASGSVGMGTPTLNGTNLFTALTLGTASPSFGTPIFGGNAFTASPLAAGSAGLGAAALLTNYTFAATVLASSNAGLDFPAFNQIDLLNAVSIGSLAAGFTTPALGAKSLLANALTNQSPIAPTPVNRQISIWTASPIISSPAGLGTAAFNQIDALSASTLTAGSLVTTQPTMGGSITAISIATGSAWLILGETLIDDVGTTSFVDDAGANLFIDNIAGLFNQNDLFTATSITSQAAALTSSTFSQNVISLSAASIASNFAALAAVILNQTKNTFTPIALASQAARIPINALNGFNIALGPPWNYTTTSPLLDTASPNLTLGAAFNLGVPISLVSGSAGIDQPAINQQQILATATSIATSAIAISSPQFVQFNLLTATNLAASAANLGTPNVSAVRLTLTPQLNFVSVDSNIQQLNAAITGINPIPSLGSTFTSFMSANFTPAVGVSNLAATSAIAIANNAIFTSSTALAVKEYQVSLIASAMTVNPTFITGPSSFIFDNELLTAVSALQAVWIQKLAVNFSASAAAVLVVNESIRQTTRTILSGNTTLFADAVKPTSQQWAGSALISPASTLSGFSIQNVAAKALLHPSFILGANIQVYIYATGLNPVSTIRALAMAMLPISSMTSPAVTAVVTETILTSANAPFIAASSIAASSLLWESSSAALGANAVLNVLLLLPKTITASMTAQAVMLPFGTIRGQFADILIPTTLVKVVESQQLNPKTSLTPISVLAAQSKAILSPSILWNAQSALAVNERILPSGTSFYFAHANMITAESQLLLSKAAALLQVQMISHEGLRMLQLPTAFNSSAIMLSNEQTVQSPVLQLFNETIFSVNTAANHKSAQISLASLTDFENQFALYHNIQSGIRNGSVMSAFPHMAMAGRSNLSPACYVDIKVKKYHTIEVGAMITAQKSRNRIVAQGNLVRTYDE